MNKKQKKLFMMLLLMMQNKMNTFYDYDLPEIIVDTNEENPTLPNDDGTKKTIKPKDVFGDDVEIPVDFSEFVHADSLKQLASSGALLSNKQNMELLLNDNNYRTMILYKVRQAGLYTDFRNFNLSEFAKSPLGFQINREGYEMLQKMSGFSHRQIQETRDNIRKLEHLHRSKTMSRDAYERYVELCKQYNRKAKDINDFTITGDIEEYFSGASKKK